MAVYFSSATINDQRIDVPPQPGWHQAENLRWMHALRYQPAEHEGIGFQPEILNSHYNLTLAKLGKTAAYADFDFDGKRIATGVYLDSKGDDLKEAKIIHFDRFKFESYGQYVACESFFYPAERHISGDAYRPLVDGIGDFAPSLNDNGWPPYSLKMVSPIPRIVEMDHTRLAGSDESKTFVATLIERLKRADVRINIGKRGIIDFFVTINKKEWECVSRGLQRTLGFIMDFIIRLRVKDIWTLDAAAICLIEDAASLDKDIICSVFPRMQFIVD